MKDHKYKGTPAAWVEMTSECHYISSFKCFTPHSKYHENKANIHNIVRQFKGKKGQ